MKLWEINNKKCIEYTKTPNYVHKKIYVNKFKYYFINFNYNLHDDLCYQRARK